MEIKYYSYIFCLAVMVVAVSADLFQSDDYLDPNNEDSKFTSLLSDFLQLSDAETSDYDNSQLLETVLGNPILSLLDKAFAKKIDILYYLESFIKFKRNLLYKVQDLAHHQYHALKGFLNKIISKLTSVYEFSLDAVHTLKKLIQFIGQLFSGIDEFIGLSKNKFEHSIGQFFK